MTSDQTDLDPNEGFDTDLGFDEGEDAQGSGKKNNPLIKIGIIAGALVLVVGSIMMFGGEEKKLPESSLPKAENTGNLPAQGDPTPEMREALVTYNQQIVEQAKQTGESVIPIPIDPARQQIETKLEETQEDPAERFRRIQEEYRRQQEQTLAAAQPQQPAADPKRQQALERLSQSMADYIQGVIQGRKPVSIQSKKIEANLEKDEAGQASNLALAGQGSGNGAAAATLGGVPAAMMQAKTVIPAATIEYGQLLLEANTDSPGPVMATMVTGPLAGSRLLGQFKETDEYLTMNFNLLVTKKGENIPINAIVLDPATTLPGMITEIDHRYFSRVILPAAASFISGVGSALAETQQTTTSTSTSTTETTNEPDFSEAISKGISESFDGVADFMKDKERDTKPMLRVAAGTPIGILFTADVMDPDSLKKIHEQQALQAQQEQEQSGVSGMLQGFTPTLNQGVGGFVPGFFAAMPGMAGVPGTTTGAPPTGIVPATTPTGTIPGTGTE